MIADIDIEGRTLHVRLLKKGLSTTYPLRTDEIKAIKTACLPRLYADDSGTRGLECLAGSEAKDTGDLQRLLKPYPGMAAWPISTKVNRLSNDSVGCMEWL